MRPDIKDRIKKIDTSGWKEVSVEFGRSLLRVSVPRSCVELTMKDVSPLADPKGEIEKTLFHPIESPTLEDLIRKKGKPPEQLTVAITVSDITRPVPYKGESGILLPIVRRLRSSGIQKEKIKIIVGTGTHRPSTAEEKMEMFGEEVMGEYSIIDHRCEDRDSLTYVGKTHRGTEVFLNSEFYRADMRIATGLVEAHFMAGVSGGRKTVCPGLVDKRTIEKFHSPDFLESPMADNLILEGNPCHEEALDVARLVGVDFIVNVTLDKEMRMTGVFAGHLEAAHLQAYHFMKDYTAVPVEREYDIILTHGGYVGRNHYQTAKAACGALPAVKQGGTVIVAADNRDAEPIGGPEYKSLLHLLKLQGFEGYLKIIENSSWHFTKDQWEVEMWGKVIRKVGEEGLIYCTLEIPREDHCLLPGQCGLDFLPGRRKRPSLQMAREMVQNAVLFALYPYREKGIEPTMAFIREGPYAVPYLKAEGSRQ
jgi:nickel-dependent lactate racemase